MTRDEYRRILKHEFDAEDGSFLIRLRCEGGWDPDGFARLTAAMEACCEDLQHEDMLERWLADGFWYCCTIIEPQAKRLVQRPLHLDRIRDQLEDLAYWFFTGRHPSE